MVTWALEPQKRRDAGEQGYVVFLILNVWFTVGLVVEARGALGPIGQVFEFPAIITIVCLLAAYTFAAKWIAFRASLVLTIVWLAMVSAWFFSWFTTRLGIMAVVFFACYVLYVWLFSAGLLLKTLTRSSAILTK